MIGEILGPEQGSPLAPQLGLEALERVQSERDRVDPVLLYLASIGQRAADPRNARREAAYRLDRAASELFRIARVQAPSATGAGELARAYPWHELTPQRLRAMLTSLQTAPPSSAGEASQAGAQRRYSAGYIGDILARVRGVMRALEEQGLISAERLQRLERVQAPAGDSGGRALDRDEILALYEAASSDPLSSRGARNGAILALLYGAGLRRGEASRLDVANVGRGTAQLLGVHAKRNKRRDVPVMPEARQFVRRWLDIRSHRPGALLLPVDKAGRVADLEGAPRLSPTSIGRALDFLGQQAGLTPFTAHDLRRSFATDFMDQVGDVIALQRILGHARPETTARYDRRGHDAAVRAVESMWS